MALIKCPECGKEISDKAKICPHCGINLNEDPNNNTHTNIVCPHCKKIFVGFKNNNPKCPYCGHKIVEQQKNLSKKHKFGLIIGSMVIFLFFFFFSFLIKHSLDEKQEKELYRTVIQAQEDVIDEYGDDIEPIQAIYLYRNLESNPPSEEISDIYDTGYYVYLTYNVNSDDEESFIWHDGNLLFNDPIPQDSLYEANIQLRGIQALEFLLLLSDTPEKTIEEINNKADGMCEIDIDILKKYMKSSE